MGLIRTGTRRGHSVVLFGNFALPLALIITLPIFLYILSGVLLCVFDYQWGGEGLGLAIFIGINITLFGSAALVGTFFGVRYLWRLIKEVNGY